MGKTPAPLGTVDSLKKLSYATYENGMHQHDIPRSFQCYSSHHKKPSPAFDLVSLDGFPDEHLLSKEISADRTLIVR